MNGQWIGSYSGTSSGIMIVNVDECLDSYRGIVYLNDGDLTLPSAAAEFRTADKSRAFKFAVDVFPTNPKSELIDSWENVKQLFPSVRMPKRAEVEGKWDEAGLYLEWKTDLGTGGQCNLTRLDSEAPSPTVTRQLSWSEFKKHVDELRGRNYLFRGQNKPWKLRTAYHRRGRAYLQRFVHNDMRILHKQLSARTRHFFNLLLPEENGAFWNLVQHHGYPTPLLDWTYSPYVAAFFAYRGIDKRVADNAGDNERVRIFVFDRVSWELDYPPVYNPLASNLHISVADFMALDNERTLPQQSVSFITNIDDIEAYIGVARQPRKLYLGGLDLPLSERGRVMEELQYMGITAASLFPGLDGVCEALKHREFET
jgi:hypothetical protein